MIFYRACPKCKGDVALNLIDNVCELYCIVCGNRKDFTKVNTLLELKMELMNREVKNGNFRNKNQ